MQKQQKRRTAAAAQADRARDPILGAHRAPVIPCRILPPGGKSPRIIVNRDQGAEMIGSIWVPEQHVVKAHSATVVRVHPDSEFRIGDRVLFGKYSGAEVEMDGYKYLVIQEKDIKALLEDELPIERKHCRTCTCAD